MVMSPSDGTGRLLLMLTAVATCATLSRAAPLQIGPSDEFMHEAVLDQLGKYKVYWKFDEEKITFEVHVETTGYVGFGFSPNGGMPGSDVVIGWVRSDGATRFTDRHALQNEEPRIDEKQDYNLLFGAQADGFTVLRFERKLDTCDDEHDWIIADNTMRLIWAYHPEVPEDGKPLPWHGRENRGSRSVYLLDAPVNYIPTLENMQEDIKTFDILNDRVKIPHHKDTTYICKGFQLPELDRKHQMAMYEPIIQHGNEALVHHITIYKCSGAFNRTFYHHHSFECVVPGMPPLFWKCRTIIMGWAVGGGPMYFPEKAGIPIGGDSDTTFLMMMTHYDNPEFKDTFIDSSGIRVHYTDKLKKYDAGLVVMGSVVTPAMVIPPREEAFTITAHCTSECTKKIEDSNSNGTEIYAFGSLLHSHLAGRAIRVHHIRDGVELPLLSQDDHYDFNYQTFRHLKTEVAIRPGDSFKVECVYNTMDRETVTYGGFGTYDEMCLAYIYIYPRTSFFKCVSRLQPETIATIVGIEELEHKSPYGQSDYIIKEPERLANMSFFKYLNHVNWTEDTRVDLQRAYERGLTFQHCPTDQGGRTAANNKRPQGFFPPLTIELLPPPSRSCNLSHGVSDGSSTIYSQKMAMILVMSLAVGFYVRATHFI